MATADRGSWFSRLVSGCLAVLACAVMLTTAAQLLAAVWPVLLGAVGSLAVVGGAWAIARRRSGGW